MNFAMWQQLNILPHGGNICISNHEEDEVMAKCGVGTFRFKQ